jgi:Mg/Co/Ni transporter MgtE
MTTDVVIVSPALTAAQAIESIRAQESEVDAVLYVYVVDEHKRLIGTFSLSELIFAQPRMRVKDFMHTKFISVNALDKQDELAQVVAKYNLPAVPVVDGKNHLLGIVSADDALDKILPTAWKKRLPRFY